LRKWKKYIKALYIPLIVKKMFECKRCGKCCENPGEIAIFEWEREIIEEEAKRAGYEGAVVPGIVARVGNVKVILQWKIKNRGKCIFFDEKERRCCIYAKRPLACRAYPLACSGINLTEAKEIIGEECTNAKIPFIPGEKITRREIVERLSREYGEVFQWAFRLDVARTFIVDLLEFYEREIKNSDVEEEIGLLELLCTKGLYDKGALNREIDRIYSLSGPGGI
jgi:Fe-S-cluster containining protein